MYIITSQNYMFCLVVRMCHELAGIGELGGLSSMTPPPHTLKKPCESNPIILHFIKAYLNDLNLECREFFLADEHKWISKSHVAQPDLGRALGQVKTLSALSHFSSCS